MNRVYICINRPEWAGLMQKKATRRVAYMSTTCDTDVTAPVRIAAGRRVALMVFAATVVAAAFFCESQTGSRRLVAGKRIDRVRAR